MDTYGYPIDAPRHPIGTYIQPMDTYITLCTPPTDTIWTSTLGSHSVSVGVNRVSVGVNIVFVCDHSV